MREQGDRKHFYLWGRRHAKPQKPGARTADVGFYRALARTKILELLEEELALVAPAEVIAKLADDPQLPLPPPVRRIDQHHLGWAINDLVRQGEVEHVFHRTKGARTVRLIEPANQWKRTRAIADARQRKAALHARYLGWASGTENHPGVLGPAAEAIVHQALARSNGYLLFNHRTGQTTVLRGAPVPGGPLDNAALLNVVDPTSNTPTGTFDVLVEVKNNRQWLYPGDDELHQLLWKSAALQQALPDTPMVPVLVCREAAHVTGTLTNALGVYLLRTKRQVAPPSLAEERVREVVDGLGYKIDRTDQPPPALVSHFSDKIPPRASDLAMRWRDVGSQFLTFYETLRREDLPRNDRDQLREELLHEVDVRDYTRQDTVHGDGDGWIE